VGFSWGTYFERRGLFKNVREPFIPLYSLKNFPSKEVEKSLPKLPTPAGPVIKTIYLKLRGFGGDGLGISRGNL
jgi:hypothetical protein